MTNYSCKLLEGVNQKNRTQYKHLYRAYYASLCHYASRFVGNKCDEEDLVQEIFIKLWERTNAFESEQALAGYLYRSVHNACLIYIRNYREKHPADEHPAGEQLAYESADNEQLLIEEEYFRQIYAAIHSMQDQRKEIVLKTLAGLGNEEIAAELNISVNTVKTLKKKAYSYLREILPNNTFLFLTFFI